MINRTPSVILRIKGGLGNQFFIYAFGRALSLRNNVPLFIDSTSGFKRDQYQRRYLLGNYRIGGQPANRWDSYDHIGERIRRVINILYNNRLSLSKKSYIYGDPPQFDNNLFNLNIQSACYFEGYYQSEKYFKDFSQIIRDELQFKGSFNKRISDLKNEIQHTNSVSLHIRRYEEIGSGCKDHIIPIEYYLTTLKILSEKLSSGFTVYCFSDNIDWARNNFRCTYPVQFISPVSENPDLSPCIDMYLMSACRHFIIANSTFSWWAAWLGAFQEKIVLAPARPFNNDDIYPDSWIRV